MMALVLAAYALAAPLGFLILVAVSGFVGRKLAGADFSWARYAGWLSLAVVLAVALAFSRTAALFSLIAALLVSWVLLRAAADAQATTLREKLGFLQLYAAFFLVLYLAVVRVHAVEGIRASVWLSFVVEDAIGHLVLPVLSVFGERAGGSGARVVAAVTSELSANFLFAAALSSFAAAGFAYAYFAEHATPRMGLSLAPRPTIVAVAFAVLVVVARAVPFTGVTRMVLLAEVFLAPFLVAEGLWVVRRVTARLRMRGAITAVLGASAIAAPSLGWALAGVGWTFHLVRLRALQPVLGDVERTSERPRLRTALVASSFAALLCVLLGLPEAGALGNASPSLGAAPSACADVVLSPRGRTVVISRRGPSFSIDADETALTGAESPEAVCSARARRLCTSDEWSLACLCTYPGESEGGTKLFSNNRLLYRLENERSGAFAAAPPEVRGLLTSGTEVVAPRIAGEGVLLAGPADAVDDPFRVDCRYRGLVTNPSIRQERWPFIAVRCCKNE